jgi:hypothetical protein
MLSAVTLLRAPMPGKSRCDMHDISMKNHALLSIFSYFVDMVLIPLDVAHHSGMISPTVPI